MILSARFHFRGYASNQFSRGLVKVAQLASSERDEAYALNRPMDDDDATLLTTRCPITRLLSPDTRNIVRN